MAAIITGESVGLERSSAWVLGSRGQLGSSGLGRDNEGVYVNAATGNLVISRQDEFLIGKGPDVSTARTYNSQAVLSDGDNNDQWQAGVYRKVIGTNGSATITRIDWDGSDTVYQMVSAGLYRTKDGAGAYDTLAWNGSQWTWTDGNSRVTDVYGGTGVLLSTSDTDGNALVYTYDAPTGLLTRVTTSNNEYTAFGYYAGTSRLEKLTTQADSQLTRVFYEYDGDGRLSVVQVNIDPLDNSKTAGANYTTTYAYDGSSKRVASIAQQDGTLLEIAYTLIGSDYRVTKLTQTVAAGVTRITGLFYDTTNRVTTITDPLGGVTTMTYDVKGNLTQLVLPVPVPGAAAPTTSFVYNANGDVESMTENGRTTAYTYDANGNMTLSRDAAGNTVKRLYGTNNQLLTETRYAGPDLDGAGAGTADTPMTARYAYDGENHLRFAVSAEGEVTEYKYNDPGQLTSTIAYTADVKDVAGLAWDVVLDETTMANWANGIGDKSRVRRTDTTYDVRGNVHTVTRYSAADNFGNGLLSADYGRDTYIHDQAGQLIDRYNNASAAIEHFVYDGLGRLVSSTDMAGFSTTVVFADAASTTTVTLANGLTRASVYNRAGERISLTQSGTDITTAVTSDYYDGLGRLRKTSDPTGRATYFLYDNASRKVADITADGAVTEYGYDSSHRLVKTIAYFNKLDSTQIASLSVFSAGGAGGANAGGGGGPGPVGSTLLVNGSFDTPGTGGSALAHGLSSTSLTGWARANGQNFEQVLAGQFSVTGTDGAYWLDLDSVPGSGALVPVGSNLLANGSFDTSGSYVTLPHGRSNTTLPNWNRVNGQNFEQVISGQFGVTGTDGMYWLDLDSVAGSGAILPTGPNLVVNGGFEQSGSYVTLPHGRSNTTLPSWTKINGETFEQILSGQFGVTASEGGWWLDLDSIPVTGYSTIGSNLVINGSFDQSGTYTVLPHGRLNTNLPGWIKVNPEKFEQVASGQFGVTGSDGAYWLDMDSYVDTGVRIAVGSSLLTNGSFENANGGIQVAGGWSSNSIPGWSKVGQARFERLGSAAGVQPADGSFWLDLDGTYSTWYGGPPPEIQSPYTPMNWIENGSFEYFASAHTNQGYGVSSSSLPAWTVHGGAPLDHVFSGQFGVAATDGDVWLDLDGPAGAASNLEISQTIAGMTAGHAFLLQFDHANRTTSESGSFEVYWNNVLVATISESSSVMQTETIQVITAAGNNVLRFRATGTEDQAGASLDNVTLMLAPPPSGGGGGGGGKGGGGGYSVWTHQNMDVSQTVPGLTAGQIVEIRFDHANRTTAASGSFEVWWNDQLVASINQTNTTMQTKSYQIAAVAGDNVLRFKGTGTEDNVGASIDKVGIYATEPVIAGGNMDISQTIEGRTAGELLELKFDHANRTTGASGSFEVWWNGSLIETITSTGTAMQTMTRTLIAIAGNNTLRFKGTGTADVIGASIDNVRLLATQPLPTGGNMDISQVIPDLAAGQTMLLEFDHANRTTGASGSFEVWWNNQLVATIDSTGTTMQSKTRTVTAVAGNNTMRFKGTGTRDAVGASVDNVRLRATYIDVGGGNMDINQIVPGLAAGQTVQLQFNHANRTSSGSGSFEVWWNGSLVETITSTGTAMQTVTRNLIAIAGNNTLRFVGTGTVDGVGASIDHVRLYATAVDVGGGNMDISQTVPGLAADQTMQLQFDHANRTTGASGSFEVYWNGALVAAINSSDLAMRTETYQVTAAAGDNVLRFKGTGTVDAVGASIDNVRLFATQGTPTPPTPAPTTDALLGMRPLASPTNDAWTWRIYDSADRLIETIDATGAATVFAYDGDSRLVSSNSYATPVDPAIVANFKTTTPTALVQPNPNTTTDRLTRNFYDNDGRVVATLDGAGGLVRFEYDEAGLKIRELGAAKAAASGLWAAGTLSDLVTSVGTSASDRRADFVYDGRGLMRFTIDATAKPVEYVYDAAGKVVSTIDYAGSIAAAASYSLGYVTSQLSATGLASNPANRIARTVYDAAGRAAFAIDGSGAVTAFAYDNVGNVIRHTAFANSNTVGDYSLTGMQSWATGQAGNGANRITRNVYDLAGRIAYSVDAEGYVTEHQYDTADRSTKDIRYAGQYTVLDNVTKSSLAEQIGALPGDAVSTAYGYDAAGRLTDVTTDVAVGVTSVTHYVLDAFGQATDTVVAYNSPSEASTTRRVFDVGGRVISETRGFGTAEAATTLFGYDRVGNLLTVTDARNNPTTRDYDSHGRVVKLTVQVDGNSGNNLITTNEYDAFGNVVRVNDPRLNNSFTYYDARGNAWLQVDAEGYATKTSYTAFGQALTVTRYATRPNGTPTVAAPPTIVIDAAKDATTSFDYDRNGRLTLVTDAELKDESYQFNMFGDRTKVRNKLGSGLLPTDPAYDSFAVTRTFDRLGRTVNETLPVAAQNIDGTNLTSSITTKFDYDSRGNLTKRTEALGIAGQERITQYFYDKAGRLIEERRAAIAWVADNLATVAIEAPSDYFTYDLRGNLIQSIIAKTDTVAGTKTLCYYDTLDRKTFEISAVGTLSKWTYDGNGNLDTTTVYTTPVAIPGSPGGSPPANGGTYRLTSFVYDRANRLTSSTIANLRTGAFNGTSYATTGTDTITTTRDYDRGGNVVREVDGVGNANRYFYDKLGRRVAKVDREDFLTVWTLASEGNADAETRYATRVSSPPAVDASVATLIGLAGGGNAAIDRTTSFTYDRNGRRLTETRAGVVAWTVNGLQLDAAGPNAIIYYNYNALGQVANKTEANGDITHFGYDNAGRLIWVKDPTMKDNNGVFVRRMTENFYDGLGNLVRTEVNKEGGAVGDDRVTMFEYGAGGRLARTVDAMTFERWLEYDAAGRVVKERYFRATSTGASVEEAIAYRYDAAGRLVTQTAATKSGGAWQFGDAVRIRYNAFGEVSGRGRTGGPDDTALYQETFDYDSAGRLWRSTQGDGSAKLFVHDRNGAATLTIASTGTDLTNDSIDAALNRLTNNGADLVGAVAVTGVTATILVMNRRGETTESREPFREISSNGAGGFNMATIIASRTYNAFGDVATEIEARGNATGNPAAYTTEYSYNSMGRMVQMKRPTVSWTSENGALANARPTEDYYYDLSGRLVGVRDANSMLTSRTLLAGTGHRGEEALVTAEYHQDNGVFRTFYDAFRETRVLRNELLNSESPAYNAATDELRAYDKMGRLVQTTQRGNLLIDSYLYDSLGQRTRHWNSFLGALNLERTDYDLQGRVTTSVAFGDDPTTTTYAWSASLVTSGLGAFGGWITNATYSNGRSTEEHSDLFGHLIYKSDLHPHAFTYAYDKGGRMTSQTTAGETLTYAHLNSGRLGSLGNGAGNSTTYGYDVAGNLLSELTYKAGAVVQNSTAGYDALGRLANWAEAGNATSPAATLAYEYDLVGNIRRSLSTYYRIDANGAPSVASTRDNWYRFDAMNQVVTEDGYLTGVDGQGNTQTGNAARGFGTIMRQAPGPLPSINVDKGTGVNYSYDVAGQRVSSAVIKVRFEGGGFAPTAYYREQKEMFDYNADGTLLQTRIATGAEGSPAQAPPPASGTGTIEASFTRDAMGRITQQTDWLTYGVAAAYDRFGIVYNARGQVTDETVATARGADIYTNVVVNEYGSGAAYVLGAVTSSTSTNKKNNIVESTATTTNGYAWWDGAVSSSTSVFTDYVSTSVPDTTYATTYSYGPTGQIASAYIGDGVPSNVTYITDMAGQILRRDETGTGGSPHEVWYRFGGKQLGFTSNNGTLDTDYNTSIGNRGFAVGNGNFRHGVTTPTYYSDFSQAIDPINSFSQGSAGGGYVVRAGDTLQSVALQLFGDQSLWYKLAEANGLSAGSALVEGQSLTIPSGVLSNSHSASTFKPYDPAKAMGDLSPTTPKPAKRPNGCGMIGLILMIAIAVAVTVVTSGAALAALSPGIGSIGAGITALGTGLTATGTAIGAGTMIAAGAIGGAVGSLASQGFGIATGQQSKINWKGVGLAAIAGGIGGAMGPGGIFGQHGAFGGITNGVLKGALRGAASSAATQGIGVATGLQDKFSWSGVAGAALSGGISGAIGDRFSAFGSFGGGLARNAVGGLANAAARTLIDGTDFGDNVIAALPDIIGQTIGNWVGSTLASMGSRPSDTIAVVGRAVQLASNNLIASDSPQDVVDPFGGTCPEGQRDHCITTRPITVLETTQEQFLTYIAQAERLDGSVANRDNIINNLQQGFAERVVYDRIILNLRESVSSALNSVGDFIISNDDDGNTNVLGGIVVFGNNGDVDVLGDVLHIGNDGVFVLDDVLRIENSGISVLGDVAQINNNQASILGDVLQVDNRGASIIGFRIGPEQNAPTFDPSGISTQIAPHRQVRHIGGTSQWIARGRGGYFTSVEDAQAVLDAVHSGGATFLGTNGQGNPVYRFGGVTGFHNSPGTGHVAQPTHVFFIKGTSNVSVVPTNPNWTPR